MTPQVHVSAHTHIGAVRQLNEDNFLAADPVFIVADGVGGHLHGERASATAIDVFRECFPAGSQPTSEAVRLAISEANSRVRALSSANDSGTAVAGTTLAGVVRVVDPDKGEGWLVLNVGDSRVYAVQDGALVQLTTDHSAVQELVDAGLITQEQANTHPDRNIITRALGSDDTVDPDIELWPVREGTSFLVCTDGLTRELTDDQIARFLSSGSDDPAAQLVTAAVAAGGHDNVTVIVVR